MNERTVENFKQIGLPDKNAITCLTKVREVSWNKGQNCKEIKISNKVRHTEDRSATTVYVVLGSYLMSPQLSGLPCKREMIIALTSEGCLRIKLYMYMYIT